MFEQIIAHIPPKAENDASDQAAENIPGFIPDNNLFSFNRFKVTPFDKLRNAHARQNGGKDDSIHVEGLEMEGFLRQLSYYIRTLRVHTHVFERPSARNGIPFFILPN